MQVSFESSWGVYVDAAVISLLWIYVLVYTYCKGKSANVGLAKLSVSCFVVATVGRGGQGIKGLVFKCTKVAFLGKTADKKALYGIFFVWGERLLY